MWKPQAEGQHVRQRMNLGSSRSPKEASPEDQAGPPPVHRCAILGEPSKGQTPDEGYQSNVVSTCQ